MRIAVLVERTYQELELWYPVLRFREEGAEAVVVGPVRQTYESKLGYLVEAEMTAAEARASAPFDAVIVPGGYAPDYMRRDADMVALVREAAARGAVVAAICHGGWMLCSAGVLKGRRATSHPAIRDDMQNAGAQWENAAVVVDAAGGAAGGIGALVTSRRPEDLPDFCRAIAAALTAKAVRA